MMVKHAALRVASIMCATFGILAFTAAALDLALILILDAALFAIVDQVTTP